MSDKLRHPGRSYITENVTIQYHSSMTNEEGDKLPGKVIEKVEAREYSLTLYFTDGSNLNIMGFTMEGGEMSSLNVDFTDKTIEA